MVALSGAIPRVEVQWSHAEFVTAVEPEYVMLSIIHARRLLKRGETADSYFPDRTRVITTTTVADDHLDRLSWKDEYEIVEAFAPAAHVPADYAVYGNDSDDDRREHARRCATGTLWMADRLAETDIELLPLIKGATESERAFGYRACEDLGTDIAAVYAAQYFTTGGGGGRAALIRDLEAIERETDGRLDTVVIGLLSPNYLAHLPENAVAAAGQRAWREPVAPRKQDAATMREVFRALSAEVADALGIETSVTEAERLASVGTETTSTTPAD